MPLLFPPCCNLVVGSERSDALKTQAYMINGASRCHHHRRRSRMLQAALQQQQSAALKGP